MPHRLSSARSITDCKVKRTGHATTCNLRTTLLLTRHNEQGRAGGGKQSQLAAGRNDGSNTAADSGGAGGPPCWEVAAMPAAQTSHVVAR